MHISCIPGLHSWDGAKLIWVWIFRLTIIYIIWFYRNVIDNGVIAGFLVVFLVVRWLFMFVVWITHCAFWNKTALFWIFGNIFICCFGVFEVSLLRLFFPHVSCQRRITPTFPVCQRIFPRKAKRPLGVSMELYCNSFHKHCRGSNHLVFFEVGKCFR